MFRAYPKWIILTLMTSTLVAGDCPIEGIVHVRLCEWRYSCIGNLNHTTLSDRCKGSVNSKVSIDLTIHDALERFEEDADPEFLKSVTSFQAIAVWPDTRLPSLRHLPKLETLKLSYNQMEKIHASPFFTLKRLQNLDLSHNSLTNIDDLFQFENQPNKLKTLNLQGNQIENIQSDTFSELTRLKELDLSYNLIADLTKELFNNLTSLETLRLNYNRIKDLNGAFHNLEDCLKHLYLSGNQIENIDESSLKVIHHLETFDVSGNQLENLRPVVFLRHWVHFSGVCKIILSGNQLTSIPNGTSIEIATRYIATRHTRESKNEDSSTMNKVEILSKVDLSDNLISNVEYDAFRTIMKMTDLDLSHNELQTFYVNPDHLRDIQFLNLSSNQIATIYLESFSSMYNLQNLDLSNNTLSDIPSDTFVNIFNLKSINMTYNKIHTLRRLYIKIFHPEGGILDLSHNGLSRFTIPDRESVRLIFLALNYNDINNANEINLVRSNELRELQMRYNKIQQLDVNSLRLPININTLDLTGNNISDIGPSTFHTVCNLKSLFLGHNQLQEIQYGAFQNLTKLSNLDLSFNNIYRLDSKVLMDLKSLSVLSLRSNGLYYLDYTQWLGHKHDILVYLDDNSYSCKWLGQAISDYNNRYSKMKPTVILDQKVPPKNSIDGIPCISESKKNEELEIFDNNVQVDERLLMINEKILKAVNEQNYFFKCLMRRFNLNTLCQSSENC